VLLPALAFSQTNLAAAWAGLSRRSIGWRLAGATVWVTFWSLSAGRATNPFRPDSVAYYAILFVAQTVLVVFCLLVARAVGLRLTDAAADLPVWQSAPRLNRLQFSLIDMLGYITALGTCMSLLHVIGRFPLQHLSAECVPAVCLAALGNGGIALAAVWFALDTGPRVDRGAVLCLLVGPAVLCLMPTVIYTYSDVGLLGALLVSLAVCLLHATLLAGSLWVFRSAGYRLALSARVNSR